MPIDVDAMAGQRAVGAELCFPVGLWTAAMMICD